jgi:hypothetical protein
VRLHLAGPEPGISSTLDARIYPRKELKGKKVCRFMDCRLGHELRKPCQHALVPVYFYQSTMSALSGALVSPRH